MNRDDIAKKLVFHPDQLAKLENDTDPKTVSETIETIKKTGIPIDQSQQSAIEHALSHHLTLLWGPAGTGKTDTLANIMIAKLLRADSGINILIGSNNYGAIDNLLEKMLDRTDLASPPLPLLFYRARSSSAKKFETTELPTKPIDIVSNDRKMIQELEENLQDESKSVIVAGTWKQLWKIKQNYGDRVEWFDICVLDEATQLGTVAAFSYFTLLKNDAAVIVAGDYRQLGTIYAYDNNLEDGLYDSIFNYYRQDYEIPMQKLNRTYRSNEHVAKWPRERFYNGEYDAHFRDKRATYVLHMERKPLDWPKNLLWDDSFLTILDPKYPVVSIVHNERTSTLSNNFESEIIASLVYLLKHVYNETSVPLWGKKLGIVSPHRAQNSLIRKILHSKGIIGHNEIPAVNTVDAFQGKQRETILSSYVVSDPDFIQKEEEFILDSRRFNVTLTRAEAKFIMIISKSITDYLSDDYEVAKEASHMQLFAKEFCSFILLKREIKMQYDDSQEWNIGIEIRTPPIV